MLKKMIMIIAVAVLSGTVSANVQAANITVQKGDTLWELSRENDTSLENIQKINHLTTDLIHPGDVLTIAPEKHYRVKKGDTLWDIAEAYSVTTSQIKEWNKLNSDLIHPGLSLLIYEGLYSTTKAVSEKPMKSATQTSNNSKPVVKAAAASNTAGPKEITVKATAYTASCEGCSGITKTGINLKANPNKKVIAVDPSVIPLGSKVHVEGFGEAIAADIGGAIKGNRIDIFIPSEQDAINFGVKKLKVTILN
ncbi:LysM peptidoglycan-binding and 3D domain-containing protein [Neobacillus drentensis]|uniref:LysM peptidoglycan-binding and 3D domain-containing protein n=1 Tax=Neobacillus drentensis TaxID=220684 RepID=UPI0008269614|nr:3D domain-containing protein [Neobacillus drentensis]